MKAALAAGDPKTEPRLAQRRVPERCTGVPKPLLHTFSRYVPAARARRHRALCPQPPCPPELLSGTGPSPTALCPLGPRCLRCPEPLAVPGAGTHRAGKAAAAEPLHFGWSEGRESKVCSALTLQQQEIVRRLLAVSAPAGANGSPGRGSAGPGPGLVPLPRDNALGPALEPPRSGAKGGSRPRPGRVQRPSGPGRARLRLGSVPGPRHRTQAAAMGWRGCRGWWQPHGGWGHAGWPWLSPSGRGGDTRLPCPQRG